MPASSDIYGQIQQPQLLAKQVNPLEQLAQAMQIKGAQYNIKKAEREDADTNALNEAYRTSVGADGKIDRNRLVQAAAAGGLGAKLPAIQKSFADQDAAQASLDKNKIEAQKQKIELGGQAMGALRADPSIANAHATIDMMVQHGMYKPEEGAQIKQHFTQDPTQIGPFADRMFRMALSAKDQLGKVETRNLGGTTQTASIDPVNNKVTVVNSVENTQSPDNKATVAASLANASATREVAKATRDAAGIQRDQQTEMKLADDWRGQAKNFREVSDAYKQINATLDKATTSPAATLAGATKFMKLIDPGSVVRESELGMALAASGIFDRATNYINVLQNGKVLTAKQAADFKDIAGQIYKAAQQTQQQIDTNYRKQAETYKLRPEMVVQDLGQNTPAPAAAGGAGQWSYVGVVK